MTCSSLHCRCWLLAALFLGFALLTVGRVSSVVCAAASVVLLVVADVSHVRAARARVAPVPLAPAGYVLMMLASLPLVIPLFLVVFSWLAVDLDGLTSFWPLAVAGVLAVQHLPAWLMVCLLAGSARPGLARALSYLGMVLLAPIMVLLLVVAIVGSPVLPAELALGIPPMVYLAVLALADQVTRPASHGLSVA